MRNRIEADVESFFQTASSFRYIPPTTCSRRYRTAQVAWRRRFCESRTAPAATPTHESHARCCVLVSLCGSDPRFRFWLFASSKNWRHKPCCVPNTTGLPLGLALDPSWLAMRGGGGGTQCRRLLSQQMVSGSAITERESHSSVVMPPQAHRELQGKQNKTKQKLKNTPGQIRAPGCIRRSPRTLGDTVLRLFLFDFYQASVETRRETAERRFRSEKVQGTSTRTLQTDF